MKDRVAGPGAGPGARPLPGGRKRRVLKSLARRRHVQVGPSERDSRPRPRLSPPLPTGAPSRRRGGFRIPARPAERRMAPRSSASGSPLPGRRHRHRPRLLRRAQREPETTSRLRRCPQDPRDAGSIAAGSSCPPGLGDAGAQAEDRPRRVRPQTGPMIDTAELEASLFAEDEPRRSRRRHGANSRRSSGRPRPRSARLPSRAAIPSQLPRAIPQRPGLQASPRSGRRAKAGGAQPVEARPVGSRPARARAGRGRTLRVRACRSQASELQGLRVGEAPELRPPGPGPTVSALPSSGPPSTAGACPPGRPSGRRPKVSAATPGALRFEE